MINIKRAVKLFFVLDLLVVLSALYFGFSWLVNTQVGFFCSFIVTVLSLFGYKKMVENRVELSSDITPQRDILEKIEDPYELYDDERQSAEPQIKKPPRDVKAAVGGFFSLYRIVGYALFFVAFLMLLKSGYFSALPFLAGVSVTPVGAVVYGLLSK
ncbi:MAG: hypothetical protein LBS73_05675 [Campylobacteraceae bacterium]|jgi:hypothetical protein|nr:hypothetical protein [Campylobacteraceae bacterium]